MKITKLTPIIRRITAGNSNMFTGPGTNSYLLGENEVTVIDPGPPMVNHIEDLISLTGKSLKQILITHTHPDHSPGASILKEMTGVPLYGLTTESSRKRDEEIDIDKILNHGDQIKTSEYSIEVIHTPGHASNHLCYFLLIVLARPPSQIHEGCRCIPVGQALLVLMVRLRNTEHS